VNSVSPKAHQASRNLDQLAETPVRLTDADGSQHQAAAQYSRCQRECPRGAVSTTSAIDQQRH
jgi:hypothetical protein